MIPRTCVEMYLDLPARHSLRNSQQDPALPHPRTLSVNDVLIIAVFASLGGGGAWCRLGGWGSIPSCTLNSLIEDDVVDGWSVAAVVRYDPNLNNNPS